MKDRDKKRLLLQLGGVILAGVGFLVGQIASRLDNEDRSLEIQEAVEKEVQRQLAPPSKKEESEDKDTDKE